MKLSIVIPLHNEAANIHPLLDELFAVLAGYVAFEVVCIDDGSRDDTLERLREQQLRRHGQLRILQHARRCGQSFAIHAGVRAARHPWIATLDGDGQNDPADIPRLLETATRASMPVLVIGHRVRRQDAPIRRLSSRVANAVRRRLLSDDTPDTGCGLKVLPRELFMALPRFDHMHRFLSALVLREGGRVRSVPVTHRPRLRGRSKYGLHNRLWVGIVDLIGVAWLQRRGHCPVRAEETPPQ